MSLYLKYRPKTLDEIKGNNQTIHTLEGMLQDVEKAPHAYLLTGPTGCGKTTIGRIIARRLGCVGNDFREVDSADFRGIDTIREIRKNSMFKSLEGPVRVWLIDECHKLTNDAQNALLKILEDTPHHIYFILCTTEPQKLIPTIKGRCSQFQMTPLNERQMLGLLKRIARSEEVKLAGEIYDQIIQDSFGLPRNALQILEQVLSVGEEERLEVTRKAAEEQSESIQLCRALLKAGNWKTVRGILNGLKDQDPESIRRHVMGYAQSVLLNGEDDRAGLVLEEFLEPFYNTGFPGLVYACYVITKNETLPF